MEMLIKIGIAIVSVFASVCIMFFAWVGLSIVEVKTELAVTHEKVENTEEKVLANYEMIKPMWQDFLGRKANGNLAWLNETADIEATTKTKVE